MARSTCPNQKYEKLTVPDHFRKLRCQNKSTPLWREAFPNYNNENISCSDHFWTFSRKSSHLCGPKYISKSKWQKSYMFGPLLDVQFKKWTEIEMSKKCMGLWREAHFQVKNSKISHIRIIFGYSVEKVDVIVMRSIVPSQNLQIISL